MSSDPRETNPYQSPSTKGSAEAPRSTAGIIWVLWLTYGSFYFCRQNLSVAIPGIKDELGYDNKTMGAVLLSLKVAYALGQLINGQLAERFSARRMLAIGMFGSAALNLLFGFGTALYFFIFVWACNGYCQSLGWTPCMRVAANWIPPRQRGKAIGVIGTGYQLTLALTYLIAGYSLEWFGWRAALYVPSLLFVAAAVHMLLFLEESPRGRQTADAGQRPDEPPTGTFVENLKITLTNPALWLLALSLGLLNACRYGFLDWGVSHLTDVQQEAALGAFKAEQVFQSAVKYAVLPAGAILGSYLAGWATDRFFGSRRAPVICGLLVLLGCLTLVYDQVARTSFYGTMVLLGAVGFCIYGPQVLLVGTAPSDLAKKGTSAAAVGFVNFMGYVGAALAGDLLTGYLVDEYSWKVAIYFWAAWAFLAAVLVAFLWNATAKE